MKGGNWRLLRSVVALSLPTVLVAALGVWFFVDRVPEIEKAEKNRVRAEYREVALEIRQNPGDERYMMEKSLPEAWRTSVAGKMAPGRWGCVPVETNGFAWVWYDGGNGVVFTQTPLVGERDYRTMFLLFGSFILLVLVGVTFFGARFLVRYAKERDDFVAATVHDLTTPLAALRLTIGRSEEESRLLVDRMVNLVRNLGDFLRLGGKRPPPERVQVDLAAACREAYAPYREDFRDHFGGEDVEIDCAAQSAAATADPTLVAQTLWNLFGNELKYAAPFGRVKVRIEDGGGKVRVVFADEGPGMSPRDRRRAFDRYFRGRSKSGKGGFGIGLCTAREFARAMGGDLTLAANDPHGCVFTLELPK